MRHTEPKSVIEPTLDEQMDKSIAKEGCIEGLQYKTTGKIYSGWFRRNLTIDDDLHVECPVKPLIFRAFNPNETKTKRENQK